MDSRIRAHLHPRLQLQRWKMRLTASATAFAIRMVTTLPKMASAMAMDVGLLMSTGGEAAFDLAVTAGLRIDAAATSAQEGGAQQRTHI